MKTTEPITLRHWPKAILHIDADSFFASVEQAINPELKGRPLITGAERGIVTSASAEAKAMGIARGTPLGEIARLHPDCLMIHSDYENYALYSRHLFDILRRFTPDVEEYSIDEAFVDLTGIRRLHHCSYEDIGRQIQKCIHTELDITVSVGISLSKSLAKLCSKFRKPQGFTAVAGYNIHELLARTPLEKIWGVGPNTAALLHKHACTTALDFVLKPRYFVEDLLGKVGIELWQELRGEYIYAINPKPKSTYGSISKTRTHTPASSNPEHIFAQLTQNMEAALSKARRFHLTTSHLTVFLKEQNFRTTHTEIPLTEPTASPLDVTPLLRQAFTRLFRPGHFYRATGTILHHLMPVQGRQLGLFEDPNHPSKTHAAASAMDTIREQFGRRSIFLGNGLHLHPSCSPEQPTLSLPLLHRMAV